MVSDACGVAKDLFEDNWTASNTDEKTPTFSKVYDKKEISLATRDYVLTYNTDLSAKFNGIGSSNFDKRFIVTIDIRTAYHPNKDNTLSTLSTVTGHQHMLKMTEEVERIIKLKKADPGSPFEIIRPYGTQLDLSDKRKGIFRFVYEVELAETNT